MVMNMCILSIGNRMIIQKSKICYSYFINETTILSTQFCFYTCSFNLPQSKSRFKLRIKLFTNYRFDVLVTSEVQTCKKGHYFTLERIFFFMVCERRTEREKLEVTTMQAAVKYSLEVMVQILVNSKLPVLFSNSLSAVIQVVDINKAYRLCFNVLPSYLYCQKISFCYVLSKN